ncbi:uncharacterized protein LOC127704956 [Mytilus californianus]|uniref:uncharacterized protein LOC127704956 n=1 Tax=Mytilus californianus TaxID=6549 RepID=UPI00224873B1|nr:uncharacterized protein LOC127704956 [Mytilus californianus]
MNLLQFLATSFFLEMVSHLVRGHSTISIQNSAFVSNKNEEGCVNYGTVYPQNDRVNEDCEVTINKMDIHDFVNKMRAQEYKISLLKINLNVSEDIKLKVNQTSTRCTISPFEWIWTFKGKNGGFQYLSLMKEFSYYSLSLLNHYTISMTFNLNLTGNCYLRIGDRNTTERLGLAFLQVFNQSFQHVNDIGLRYGYICYLSRTYLEHIIYMFSKYIISSKQSMGYRCCRNAFNKTTHEDTISCTSDTVMIDSGLWWNFPYVMGWLLFLFLPLLFLQCSEYKNKNVNVGHGKWLLSNPVSFGTVLRNPFNRAYASGNICSRLLKIICILLTSLFVILEVLSYYYFMNDFVVSSTKAEVPFNWITMAAGYSLSMDSFLPCFGGPYIALGLYYISSAFLLCLPTDLSKFVDKGIDDKAEMFMSLLTVDMSTKGKLGAILNIRRQAGYTRLNSVLRANIYMLINPTFWDIGFQIQKRRFNGFIQVLTRNRILCKLVLTAVLVPVYFCICIIEWVLAIFMYGLPVVGFFFIILNGYYNTIREINTRRTGTASFVLGITIIVLMSVCVTYDIYIFSLLFIDSFIFLCRICTYSFAGLIAYPDITYGYLVFTITVMIYVTECIQHVNAVYTYLFETVKNICIKIKKEKHIHAVPLISCNGCTTSVSKLLFRYVVRYYRPLRIEILFSCLKLTFIVIILYMSISILLTFKELSKMSTLTQAITALFICLIPKLWHMFEEKGEKYKEETKIAEIKNIIEQYCRCYIHKRTPTNIQDDSSIVDDMEHDTSNNTSSDDELLQHLLLDVDIE